MKVNKILVTGLAITFIWLMIFSIAFAGTIEFNLKPLAVTLLVIGVMAIIFRLLSPKSAVDTNKSTVFNVLLRVLYAFTFFLNTSIAILLVYNFRTMSKVSGLLKFQWVFIGSSVILLFFMLLAWLRHSKTG